MERGAADSARRGVDDVPRGADRTTVLISMTREQKAALQHRAVDEGTSVAALVRKALREYGAIS